MHTVSILQKQYEECGTILLCICVVDDDLVCVSDLASMLSGVGVCVCVGGFPSSLSVHTPPSLNNQPTITINLTAERSGTRWMLWKCVFEYV